MAPTRLKPRARSGNQRQRPSTMIDVDENLETRRERNRKAQHLFRVRKHAALASQKKLLGRLEDTVEQLTATFLSLTDAVLQSPGLSQDPGLIVKLRAATNNVIILVGDLHTPSSDSERAQTIEEDDQAPDDLVCSDSVSPPIVEDRASNSTIDCNLAHHNLSSSDNVSYATSDERGTSSIAKPERFSASTTSPVNDDPITKLTSERVSILTHTPDLNSPTAPLITNAFGNGWTSIPPSVVRRRQLDRIAGRYQPHVGTLSAMIARAALQHAYDTMLNARDISTAAVKRIFEFPLRFLSREEILMGLRWYLRPGSRDMPQLASAPFDGAMEFYTDSYVADLLPITAEPTYSQQIRPQLNSSAAHFSNQFMNAHEIEQHLWASGMRYLDHDIIELSLSSYLKEYWIDGVVGRSTALSKCKSSPSGSLYNFDVFFPVDEAATGQSIATTRSSEKVLLSQSQLITTLMKISICIARGPAFSKEDVRLAITASIIAA